MSVFTNSASSAREHREQYTSAVLGLLGDADPNAVLETMPAWCERETSGLSAAELRRPEEPGKWSLVEILQHLADSELVWGYRLRKVLAEDRPELTGYDQDLWATRLRYAASSREESLATFRALRLANLRLLAGASEADLDRVGIHNERGAESVRHMVRLYAGHDLLHRNQIARVRQAVAS
jgi:uncharacterized damage-inducible protein DinB